MKDLRHIEERAKAVEESVIWWEGRVNEALEKYEEAQLYGGDEELKDAAREMKMLLGKAEVEKKEMAKIETLINEACVDAAFKGNFKRKG